MMNLVWKTGFASPALPNFVGWCPLCVKVSLSLSENHFEISPFDVLTVDATDNGTILEFRVVLPTVLLIK